MVPKISDFGVLTVSYAKYRLGKFDTVLLLQTAVTLFYCQEKELQSDFCRSFLSSALFTRIKISHNSSEIQNSKLYKIQTFLILTNFESKH